MSDRLCECRVCGAVGLRERIEDHDCPRFLARQRQQWRRRVRA